MLAPTDMAGWAESNPNHQEYLSKVKQLIIEGKGEALVNALAEIKVEKQLQHTEREISELLPNILNVEDAGNNIPPSAED